MPTVPYRVKKSPISDIAKGYVAYKKSEEDKKYKKAVLGLKKTELGIAERKLEMLQSGDAGGMSAKEAADAKLAREKHEQDIKEFDIEQAEEKRKDITDALHKKQESDRKLVSDLVVAKKKSDLAKEEQSAKFTLMEQAAEKQGGRAVSFMIKEKAEQARIDLETFDREHPQELRDLELNTQRGKLLKVAQDLKLDARNMEIAEDDAALRQSEFTLKQERLAWDKVDAIAGRVNDIAGRRTSVDSAEAIATANNQLRWKLAQIPDPDGLIKMTGQNIMMLLVGAIMSEDDNQKKMLLSTAKDQAAYLSKLTESAGNKIDLKIPVEIIPRRWPFSDKLEVSTDTETTVGPMTVPPPEPISSAVQPDIAKKITALPKESQEFVIYMDEQITKQGKEAVRARWEQVKSKYTKEEQEIIESMLK